MNLEPFKAPPSPPNDAFQKDLERELDRYFEKIRAFLNPLFVDDVFTVDDGDIGFPHGAFSDSTTQVSGGTTSENLAAFDTDEIKYKITHSTVTNNSRIYIDVDGVYRIDVTATPEASVANKTARFWLKVDGVNVPRTGVRLLVPTNAAESVTTFSYIYRFTAGQYFQIAWCSVDNAGMQLTAVGAGANPTRPASPSIMANVFKISK